MNTFRTRNDRLRFASIAACSIAVAVLSGCQADVAEESREGSVATATEALHDGSAELRQFIARQVGGLEKLKVPADDSAIPLPPEDPNRPGRYKTTEAKRYLGKLLFHDPLGTARINVNTNVNPPIRQGEPRDLPQGTAFGGTVSSSDPNVKSVVDSTRNTGSCGSCHLGEAAGKAGAVVHFNVGGEGRGYTDENGDYVIRTDTARVARLGRQSRRPTARFQTGRRQVFLAKE